MREAATDTVTETLTIAVWQHASAPGDVAANLAALDDAARRAREAGASLLVTPEMFLTGYNIGVRLAPLALTQPLEHTREIAVRREIGLVVGGPELAAPDDGPGAAASEHAEPRIFNAAWLIDERGEVLARHRKIQLFGDLDRSLFVAGDAPVTVAEFHGFTVAMLVCFDVEFPETVRAAARAGADLVAVPTAQMEPFSFVNEHLIRVRAWENGVYVAYANHVGVDGDLTYVGRSVIADPLGQHVATAGPTEPALLLATLERGTLDRARAQSPYVAELRGEVFGAPA